MLAEYYLDIACNKLPTVNHLISRYGNVPLSTYLENFSLKPGTSYQKMDDILEVVSRYTEPLLGESVARRVVRDLAAYPVVLTANHHGVDCFSQSIQGSLLFALNTLAGKTSSTTVPIFACGNVPLDNLTYPQGLLLYHVTQQELNGMPRKLPVFSNKYRRRLVSVSGPFDQAMVRRAETRVDKMVEDRKIYPSLADPLHKIFREDYCAPSVIELPNYSQQAVVLNNSIWKRLFSDVNTVPEIVYLELEKIGSALLEKDLTNSESLAWCVMFDPALREHVLYELDGVRACWQRKKLLKRLRMDPLNENQKKETNGCGTIFFWGVDDSGKRAPLYLEAEGSNGPVLRGVDVYGKTWELAFSPMSVIEGLHENRLLPSLFASFLVISMARGVTCAGGYFQGEYLPAMQRGVVNALKKINGYHDVAHLVSQVPTDAYLSGMLAIMTRLKGYLIPAGPVEIIAGCGITGDDIEKMLALTVRDAHMAALFETVPDIAPPDLYRSDWKKHLAVDCSRLLEGKIVIK